MNCKNCGAPMDGDRCPVCGQAAEPEVEPAAEQTAESGTEQTAAPETEPTAETMDSAPAEAPKKSGHTGLIIALAAAILVIVVLVVMLVQGRKNTETPAEAPETEETAEPAEEPAEEPVEEPAEEEPAEEETPFVPSVSYVREEGFDDALLDQVVASCGDSTLTNRYLAYYYWREYYAFVNMYGSYLSYLMDPYARLDTQAFNDDTSWDQRFMESALDTYQICAAAAAKARAEGYTLSEEERDSLDNLEADISGYAAQYGFESADAYIEASFGPYCDMASYQAFMEEYILAASYLDAKLAEQEVSEDELETYYEENKADYESAGLEKDDTPMVNVRHILIQPEAVELQEGDEGYEEAVEAAKDAARAKAEELYAQWQSGEQTEDAFAELAKENSSDGSAADGGLIENIYPGQTVEAFDAWCFEDGRKTADTGVVETEYGYHVIYFVGQCEESYWYSVVSADYASARYQKLCTDVRAEYPVETDLTKAAVYPCNTTVQQ